ncbi:MAG: hypothetical protein A2X36_13745 [Elusimicrobia bacterium GWA2_69_24]|nr:MAG: hypothetical protein A2X36_13745 [Elusimicrobia bacterium GWA2_69_24]HBL18154.1 CoA pyrophosphatase [Elusimicrobiota bacterium]
MTRTPPSARGPALRSFFREVRSRLPPPVRIAGHGTQEAAVSVILTPGPQGPRLLLIHRAKHPRDPWSGQIGLPGGRREPSDPDLLATAIRETREETAIVLRESHLLGELDDLRPTHRGLPRVTIRPFVFGLTRPGMVVPSPEVDGFFWACLKCLRSSAGLAEIDYKERTLAVPAFHPEGKVVWGITHSILKGFLDALEG